MKWFKDCPALEEVKAKYKKLAKKYHPDLGGDTATMQEINKEYAFATAKALTCPKNKRKAKSFRPKLTGMP